MEKLMQVLQKNFPQIDFENETGLIEYGMLNSLDIILLVGELNDTFGISITADDLLPENFNSAAAMYKLIQKLMDK